MPSRCRLRSAGLRMVHDWPGAWAAAGLCMSPPCCPCTSLCCMHACPSIKERQTTFSRPHAESCPPGSHAPCVAQADGAALGAAVQLLQAPGDGEAGAAALRQVCRRLPAALHGCTDSGQIQEALAALQVGAPPMCCWPSQALGARQARLRSMLCWDALAYTALCLREPAQRSPCWRSGASRTPLTPGLGAVSAEHSCVPRRSRQ